MDDPARTAPNPSGSIEIREQIRNVPGLVWLLNQVGIIDIDLEITELIQRFDHAELAAVLAPTPDAGTVAFLWKTRVDERRDPILIELLLFDYCVSRVPFEIRQQLPSWFKFDKTIHTIHQFIASKLYDQAKDATWRRPYVLCRALQMSKIYFKRIIEAEGMVNVQTMHQFQGKFAVASALRSRHIPISSEELVEAEAHLRRSIDGGNTDAQGSEYLAEIALRTYDTTGDPELLKAAIRDLRKRPGSSGVLKLHETEMWLRLSALTEQKSTYIRFLRHALTSCEEAQPDIRRSEQQLRQTILHSIIGQLIEMDGQGKQIQFRAIRLPFGLAEYISTLPRSSEIAHHLIRNCLLEIEQTGQFRKNEPIARRIVADAYSALARLAPAPPDYHSDLRRAVDTRIRQDTTTNLRDEISLLYQATDMLELSDETMRREAVGILLSASNSNVRLAAPLIVIGRDIELRGPVSISRDIVNQLRDKSWVTAVTTGSFTFFYELAATRALSSTDLRRRHLGGRGSVMTVEDHFGIAANTFVFKGTTQANFDREKERIDMLTARVGSPGRFRVPELLLSVRRPEGDPSFADGMEIVSLQRYSEGLSVRSACSTTDTDKKIKHLDRCVEFLARIHSIPEFYPAPATGVRKDMKEHDLGLWLKRVVGKQSYLPLFEQWWNIASSLPVVPKRDAHLENWLVDRHDRITAIDLESAGFRPVGYELAQLTDDFDILDTSDLHWKIRTALLHTYIRSSSIACSMDEHLLGYTLGLLARSVRLLGDSDENSNTRKRGLSMIEQLVHRAPTEETRDLADQWHATFSTLIGSTSNRLSKGKRIALSKTLAFILRHDTELCGDSKGWHRIAAVLARAEQVGRPMSREELVSVATSPTEQRFEITGDYIRARYGHTVADEQDHPVPERFPDLFHSTDTSAMNRVFDPSGGLLPMERQWVHLSEDPHVAVRVGARKKSPILLRVRGGVNAIGLAKASPKTWLAARVPPENLEYVSIMEQLWLGLLQLDI
ncbi:RNA 2'-phosphotransferase [Nocardia sp. NPDC050713]|uniref:RNA 2'-phosphotransferase n=1 Tax=Nocardia sp. NPDC050713 TaxID=3154511 RepID=UPI0033CE9BCA